MLRFVPKNQASAVLRPAGDFLCACKESHQRKHGRAEHAMGGPVPKPGERTKTACTTQSSQRGGLHALLAKENRQAKRAVLQFAADGLYLEFLPPCRISVQVLFSKLLIWIRGVSWLLLCTSKEVTRWPKDSGSFGHSKVTRSPQVSGSFALTTGFRFRGNDRIKRDAS